MRMDIFDVVVNCIQSHFWYLYLQTKRMMRYFEIFSSNHWNQDLVKFKLHVSFATIKATTSKHHFETDKNGVHSPPGSKSILADN
jgi:hypothetical protein